MTQLAAARRLRHHHAYQVVGGQGEQETDEGPAHGARIQLHGVQRSEPGTHQAGDAKQQGVTQIDAVALVVAPDRQHHVGHHHDQGGALSQLLIQTEQHAQHRNGDQAAADTEQPTHGSQSSAQDKIQ